MADVKPCISLAKSNCSMTGVAVISGPSGVLSDLEHICIRNQFSSYANIMDVPGLLTATRVIRKRRQKTNCILMAVFKGTDFRYDGEVYEVEIDTQLDCEMDKVNGFSQLL